MKVIIVKYQAKRHLNNLNGIYGYMASLPDSPPTPGTPSIQEKKPGSIYNSSTVALYAKDFYKKLTQKNFYGDIMGVTEKHCKKL